MSNKLLYSIIAGVLLAFGAVFVFQEHCAHVYWLGLLFLQTLQMLIIPLIMFSVMAGITRLGDTQKLGRLGGWTAGYYFGTMAIAGVIGLVVVNLFSPGVGVDLTGLKADSSMDQKQMSVVDLLLKLVSENVVESMAKMDILPVIVFSLFFGVMLLTIGEKGKPLVDVIEAANETIMAMVRIVMWLAPVGIFGLIAGRFGKALSEGSDAFIAQLSAMGWLILSVLSGLALHAFLVLPLLLWLFARRNPLSYARGLTAAIATAFSTSSSSATLPVTIEATTQNNEVDPGVAQFVLPLGATVNMDGTALYEAIAAVFVAQAAGVQLDLGTQCLVVLVATLSAIGAAGIPEAGLVTMMIVLKAANLPLAGLALLLPIDWFLDRFRTAVNVWGDAVGAGVLASIVEAPEGAEEASQEASVSG